MEFLIKKDKDINLPKINEMDKSSLLALEKEIKNAYKVYVNELKLKFNAEFAEYMDRLKMLQQIDKDKKQANYDEAVSLIKEYDTKNLPVDALIKKYKLSNAMSSKLRLTNVKQALEKEYIYLDILQEEVKDLYLLNLNLDDCTYTFRGRTGIYATDEQYKKLLDFLNKEGIEHDL